MHTLLIDGFLGRHDRLGAFRERIESRQDSTAEIWKYDSVGRHGIDHIADELENYVSGLGTPVNLVGYSMGGLVAKYFCKATGGAGVSKIATINSPHSGTLMAYSLPIKALYHMRPNSEFLNSLDLSDIDIPKLAVWCPLDLMVVPGSNARWNEADVEIKCDMPAHIWPIFSKNIQNRIIDWLEGS